MSTVSERISMLRSIFPRRTQALFLYTRASDLRRRGTGARLYVLISSEDGRASVHSIDFSNRPLGNVEVWGRWLRDHAPGVITDRMIPAIDYARGSTWRVEHVLGWHFI